MAKPLLVELIKTDLLSVFKFVYWYAKNKSNEWVTIIEDNASRIDDCKTFWFCASLLREMNVDYSNIIIPFTKNGQEHIRKEVFYTLGLLKNKKDFIETFIEGLKDNSK